MRDDFAKMGPGMFLDVGDNETPFYRPSRDAPKTMAEAAVFMAFWKGSVEWRRREKDGAEYESAVTVTLDTAPVSVTAPTFLLAVQAASLVVLGMGEL